MQSIERIATVGPSNELITMHHDDAVQAGHGGGHGRHVLIVALLLTAVLAHGTAEKIHGRLLTWGELMWPGYAAVRSEVGQPTCDPKALAAPPTPAGGGGSGGALDDLLGAETDDASARQAAAGRCERQWEGYRARQKSVTSGMRAYLAFEGGLAWFVDAGVMWMRHVLILLTMVCALVATRMRGHIGLRDIHTAVDEWVSQAAQLAANGLLLASWVELLRIEKASSAQAETGLMWLWIGGLSCMMVANGVALLRQALGQSGLKPGGQLHHAFLTVPLYAVLALIASGYFMLKEHHVAGVAIFLQMLTEHALLYVHVGLYVFVGMLLKETRLAQMMFGLLRPWKLSPEILACVVAVAAALPTAYSGASGIFVIAAGAVVYEELRRAGARRQVALAATAMSGSLGVVLSPCLLVVIVASLNKQVTTGELFYWGNWVFALTAFLYVLATLVLYRPKLTMAPWAEAWPQTRQLAKPLLPYLVISALVVLGYKFALQAPLNEHTAPMILPVLFLILLAYDRRQARKEAPAGAETPTLKQGLLMASSETTGHIGALLTLMAVSVALGGVVERTNVMSLMPHLDSAWLTMTVLVGALIVIGMTMDPYGAVILVSASIADVAYKSGIHPVHFWMTVLCAFELGYLTPPVALNHLLTARVVKDDTAGVPLICDGQGWREHEHIVFPVLVMGSALLIVAYVPLFLRP